MKIAYISAPYFTDCDIPLLQAFERMGHEVFFFLRVTPYSLHATKVDIAKQYERNGIFHFSIYPELNDIANSLSHCQCFVVNDIKGNICYETVSLYHLLANKLSEIIPDAVQFVGIPDLRHMPLFSKFRKQIVLTVHDPLPHGGEQRCRSELFRRIAFKICNQIVILNEIQLKAFVETYHIPSQKITVASLGLYDMLHRQGGAESTRSSESEYVLFYGRISPYKGLEYLLPAFERVHDKLPSTRLVVAGAGEYYFDVSRYNNSAFIDFINRYVSESELASLISSASFVVCPYSDATQSGVVSTVLALGTPMIVTNVGTMPEMVKKYDAGLVVPSKDEDALYKAMFDLLSDKSLLCRKRNNLAVSLSEVDSEWNSIAEKYIAAYLK